MKGDSRERDLDRILGLDPDPTLAADAARQIAASVRATAPSDLDRLLALDVVDVPEGLGQRVARGVRAAARPRMLPRATFGVLAAAAAAALVLAVLRGGRGTSGGTDRTAQIEAPSDEFLSALPALEQLDFLMDELDPLELDALLLFDDEDRLMLELLEEDS